MPLIITEHKFPSGVAEFTIALPVGAFLLQPRAHGPQPVLPVLGDPAAKTEMRTFRVYHRTATKVQPDTYVGTFELAGFPYHVFEVRNAPTTDRRPAA